MTPIRRLKPFIITIVLALLLQLGFIALDCKHAPYEVAVNFAKAYYRLDPAMAVYLRTTGTPGQNSAMVNDFIYRTGEETKNRGFDLGMAKSVLFNLKTHTVFKSDTEAQVLLTASRRTAINPVFPIIASIFKLGKITEVNETISMIKENGAWKVICPVFNLSGS